MGKFEAVPAYEGYAVHIGYVRVLLDVLEQHGIDPARIWTPQRLAEIRAATANARVPLQEWHGLMNAAEGLLGDPWLVLRLAESVKPWHTGLVGFMAMTSATLLEVGSVLARYHHLLNDIETVEAGTRGDRFALDVRQLTALRSPRISLLTLGSWAWRARWLTGRPELRFDADLPDPEPGAAARLRLDRTFGGTLRFGQPHASLLGPRDYLALPVIHQEPSVNRLLQREAQQQADEHAEATGSFLARLERRLAAQLGGGEVTLASLASEMEVAPRTLQRRLEDAGLSFRSVVERVRKNQALAYLADPRLSLIEIALMLGFSNQTSFHHAFKRWTGHAPGEFRRRPS